MGKLARLPVQGSAPVDGAAVETTAFFRRRFYAFLSYSHKDSADADWLHRELERFRVPRSLAGRLTANGVVPKRLSPVFRDRHELAAADDLGTEIRSALASSQFLIVLCSPDSARSHWANAEIECFKRSRPDGCVFAAIVGGEPYASDIPGREDEECFPRALRYRYDRRGRPTTRRAEPLAADLRDSGEGRRLALLKIIAGMLGVGLDELVQRETTRRHRQLAWLAAASLAGMAVTSTLALTAVQARDNARDQRREAEGLISFMLGDLKDKLEPIGRLDALDGVGSRVLDYYRKQDTSALSDSSLMQRSKALSLMASVANSRGDLPGATQLYREALAGTSEAIRRKPSDPQRIFDHAQNVFYVGDIAIRRGDEKAAEAAFREYKALSNREVALDPNNMKWRMEVQSADANLGVMLFNQRRFREASRQFEQAFGAIKAFTAADSTNIDYRKSMVESLAWLADSHLAEGRIDAAIADRQRDVALIEQLLAQTRDSEFRAKLIAAERTLASLFAVRGDMELAVEHAQLAAGQADQLLAVEFANSKWVERAASSHLDWGKYLLAEGKTAAAAAEAAKGCALADRLFAKDANVAAWRILRRQCFLVAATVALATADPAALTLASRGLAVAKSVDSTDRIDDRYAIARAYLLLGDAERAAGNRDAARAAWSAGLAAIPVGITERPMEMGPRQLLLQRLGRTAEAARLASKLSAMGYREPEFGRA
ncbi:tetratricopeptide (TPR) repeat protein [Sphingomonas sp. F9_3S_D5_B_2]